MRKDGTAKGYVNAIWHRSGKYCSEFWQQVRMQYVWFAFLHYVEVLCFYSFGLVWMELLQLYTGPFR